MRMALDMSLARVSGFAAGAEPPIVDNNNTTVTDQGNDFWRVTKTGGSDAVWGDAGAVGTQAITGDFLITAQVPSNTQAVLVGVNVDPLADDNFASVDRGMAPSSDGNFYGVNDGAFTNYGGYVAGFFFLRRVGTTVTVLSHPTDNIGSATLKGTLTAYGSTCYLDIVLYTLGGYVDVRLT